MPKKVAHSVQKERGNNHESSKNERYPDVRVIHFKPHFFVSLDKLQEATITMVLVGLLGSGSFSELAF